MAKNNKIENLEELKNKEFELDIIDTSKDGLGVGKLNGLTIFVPFAIEGEKVIIQDLELHKNYATAKLKKIITISPRRAVPPCPYYEKCGGCQLMHLNYDTQLLFKQLSLTEIFKSADILVPISSTKASMEYEFRNNVQLKVEYEPELKIGFYAPRSHTLIDIKNCIVCDSWFSIARKIIYNFLNETKNVNKIANIFITCFRQNDELNIQINLQSVCGEIKNVEWLYDALCEEFKIVSIWGSIQEKNNTLLNYKTCKHIAGEENLVFNFLNQKISLQPTDFFQINTAQAENIFNYLKNQIEIIQPQILVDLFCGIGVFSTAVSKLCKDIYAVDINKNAIQKAKLRAEEQGLYNIKFYAGDCNKIVFDLDKNILNNGGNDEEKSKVVANLDSLVLNNSDNKLFAKLLHSSYSNKKVLFLDPSRVGAGKNVLNFINNNDFNDVFYLSCNPYSLVKDLKELEQNYKIIEVTPFDMFPQTNKIETLVHLKRLNKDNKELMIEAEKLKILVR